MRSFLFSLLLAAAVLLPVPLQAQTEPAPLPTEPVVQASPGQAATAPAEVPPAAEAPNPAAPATGAPPVPQPPPPSEPAMRELPPTPAGKGVEAWYYEAKKLETGGKPSPETSAYIEFLYRLAFLFGPEAEAKEAGRALVQRAQAAGDQGLVLARAAAWIEAFGPDWSMFAARATAGLAAGDWQAALEAAGAARRSLGSATKARAAELAFYEYSARAGLAETAWLPQAFAFLRNPSLDSWGAKVLRLAAAAPGADPSQAELALMRADFQEKNYAQGAAHASRSLPSLLAPGVQRHLVSEAARSFLNAGDYAGGLSLLANYFPAAFAAAEGTSPAPLPSAERVAETLTPGKQEERLWVAAYYLARLWQARGDTDAAAVLFLALTEAAPSAEDSDGALWNWLDLTLKRIAALDLGAFGADPVVSTLQAAEGAAQAASGASPGSAPSKRPFELGALVEASQRWKNPASFDDLVDGYDRSLLKAKAWDDALALLSLLGPRLAPATRTRFLYLDARLVELGLATTSPADRGGQTDKAFSRDAFGRILSDAGAEEYYRTLSAWRLGLAPPFLLGLPDLSVRRAQSVSGDASGGVSGASVQAPPLIDNYLAFDLDELAGNQALKYLGTADKTVVASLAFKLSSQGQHYPALRLARDAVNRGLGGQYPELYGLVYPRAWPDIVAEGAAIPKIPEALAYAIIRSESVFDPLSVSYAGATGLTQLMPDTAAETAKGLKMTNFSITDPRDNVRIGMTYYSYMLDRFGGKPMRAMFAYNAGPSRMSVWNKESGELPDDILLETLHIAQPRQYAKNIIQAALAYGKLHYAIDPLAMLDYLVEARPLPAKAPPVLAAAAGPAATATPALSAQAPLPAAAAQAPPEPAGQSAGQQAPGEDQAAGMDPGMGTESPAPGVTQ